MTSRTGVAHKYAKGVFSPITTPSPAPSGTSSNPSGGAETEAEKSWWKSWGSSVVHVTLDVVGLIPVVGQAADLANSANGTAYKRKRTY